MKKVIAILGFVLSSTNVNAGWLAQEVMIDRMTNIAGNVDKFNLSLVGTNKICNNVYFKESSMPGTAKKEALQRAMALAMLAFTTSRKVSVHNYVSNDCEGAAYIEIMK